MDQLLNKIYSTGYWRVNIRPTRFEQFRISSLTACRAIVESCVVQLRGWPYPRLHPDRISNGEHWVQAWSDFMGQIEYWRFYQSGQFIHHFACREDYEIDPSKARLDVLTPSPSGRYLSILSSLYTVTELFEFAARLASTGVLTPAADISIKLAGTEGRQLFFWDVGRFLGAAYVSQIPEMTFSKTYREADLLARAKEFALDATEWIFERFNWSPVPKDVLAEDQRKLLERRL